MKTCCGTSVGVLVTDDAGRVVMVDRGWWPLGTAPVAGHVKDAHDTPEEAAVAEVKEEVGLSVTSLTPLAQGHRPNLCASAPHNPPGHYWWLFRATATGTLRPAQGETRGAAWYTPDQVHALARRTIDHARGSGSAETLPQGALEAVWVAHLAQTGHITASAGELAAVERLYATPPSAYWQGGRR